MNKSTVLFLSVALLASVGGVRTVLADDIDEQRLADLGKKMFFDQNLSVNKSQSCASCHAQETGFTGPDSAINAAGAVEPGAVPERFGNRKPPSSAYAGESPLLGYDEAKKTWFGGMFWDGRATGWTLGDPLAEQAMGPFLNPLEMNMPDAKLVVVRVAHSEYAAEFESLWGPGSLDFTNGEQVQAAYVRIAQSIAAYERSEEVNPYTSKFDLFYQNAKLAGKNIKLITTMGLEGMGGQQQRPDRWGYYRNLGLSDDELKGLAVFNDSMRMGGNCASCHRLDEGPDGYPLFTDFGYYNLGIPKNPENPFYTMPKKWNPDGMKWIDYGLGGFLKKAGYETTVYQPEMGKFKTPSLRNIDLRPSPDFVKAFGHNGFFKSMDGMKGIVHFYAWRAMMDTGGMGGGGMGNGGMGGGGMTPDPSLFPSPEYDENRIVMKPFNFMMHGEYLIAFLKTLSDGYTP